MSKDEGKFKEAYEDSNFKSICLLYHKEALKENNPNIGVDNILAFALLGDRLFEAPVYIKKITEGVRAFYTGEDGKEILEGTGEDDIKQLQVVLINAYLFHGGSSYIRNFIFTGADFGLKSEKQIKRPYSIEKRRDKLLLCQELTRSVYQEEDLHEFFDREKLIKNEKLMRAISNVIFGKVTIANYSKDIERAQQNKMTLLVDKLNSYMWYETEKDKNTITGKDGKQAKVLKTGEQESGEGVYLFYNTNFFDEEGIELSLKLNAYDDLVHTGVVNAYILAEEKGQTTEGGGVFITLNQIFRCMGYDRDPKPNEADRLNDCLDKMRSCVFYCSNEREIDAGFKYPKISYDGILLPFERIIIDVNDNITENVIILHRTPILLEMSKGRGQIAKVDRYFLGNSKGQKNNIETSLPIKMYFLRQIARAKRDPKSERAIINGKKARNNLRQKKFKYSTVFKQFEIEDRMKQSRAREAIEKIMKRFKGTREENGEVIPGLIEDYKIHTEKRKGKDIPTAVTVYFLPTKKDEEEK